MADSDIDDFYQLLGIQRTATADEIRQAYREIARVYHPDSQFYSEIINESASDGDDDKFRRITEAYNVLGDNETRTKYDAVLAEKTTKTAQFSAGSMGVADGRAAQIRARFADKQNSNRFTNQAKIYEELQAGEEYSKRHKMRMLALGLVALFAVLLVVVMFVLR